MRGLPCLHFCWGTVVCFFLGGGLPSSFCFSFTDPKVTGFVGVGAVSVIAAIFGAVSLGLACGFGRFVGCVVCVFFVGAVCLSG